jgi:hypothetical protein
VARWLRYVLAPMAARSSLVVALVALVATGCVAPQEPGLARVGFATMATFDGAVGGAVVGVFGCGGLTFGLSEPRPWSRTCLYVVSAVGAGAALAGTLTADDEPELSHWVGVSTPPLIAAVTAIVALVDALRGPPAPTSVRARALADDPTLQP